MTRHRTNTRARCRCGFTLVEATLSVVIVGTMLVASTGVFGSIAKARTRQAESRLAYLLAGQLMSEVMQCPFERTPVVFGPQSGQTRATFNAVDAYDGYTAAPPVSQAGAALTEYAGWKQAVVVVYADVAAPASTATGASPLKRITVIVTSPSGKPYVLQGLRSKFGPYEAAPAVRATYVTGVSVSVQAAAPAKTIYTGAHPLNVSTSQ